MIGRWKIISKSPERRIIGKKKLFILTECFLKNPSVRVEVKQGFADHWSQNGQNDRKTFSGNDIS